MSYDFDLFTIGAGSGGVRASRVAASYGAKVGIAEEFRLGGTCVIRGCVPKKLLWYASHYAEDLEDAKSYGWSVGATSFSWPALIANKDKEIERLSQIYRRNLGLSGVQIFETRAVLKDPHTVHLIGENRDVTAERILIATGASPQLPSDVDGCKYAITSNEAFHLPEQPKHITILGAGYVALEFAGIFHGLGSKVTLIHHGPRVLRHFDHELGLVLAEEMVNSGVELRLQERLSRIEKTDDGFVAVTVEGERLRTDLVMAATGRVPHSKGMGLEAVGVEMKPDGSIVVDGYSRTSVKNISAIGDVTNRLQLTPIAIREGAAFAETEFNNNPINVDHDCVPTAIFSSPPIGTVGMSEAEAVARFGAVDIYKTQFRPMKHTLTGRAATMFMKLVVEPESDRVLGCHILGPDAGELIQALGIAVKMGAKKRDFDNTVAVHPTGAEEIVLLKSKTRVERQG